MSQKESQHAIVNILKANGKMSRTKIAYSLGLTLHYIDPLLTDLFNRDIIGIDGTQFSVLNSHRGEYRKRQLHFNRSRLKFLIESAIAEGCSKEIENLAIETGASYWEVAKVYKPQNK